jgi:uncharacterized phage-like protein YoqJ
MDEMNSSNKHPEEDTTMSTNANWNEQNWKHYQQLVQADQDRRDKIREQGKKWRQSQQAQIEEAKRIVENYKREQAGLNKK